MIDNLRIGKGFDIHRLLPLAEGEKGVVPLCGIPLPANCKVLAHSDGDVALHALCDALLGAVAMGDIGIHFPPSDEQYKGISSIELLKKVMQIIKSKNARVINVDINILAEHPKVAPYQAEMRAILAKVLEVEVERVSIKATTMEKLGAIGRREGIAAEAVCLLEVL